MPMHESAGAKVYVGLVENRRMTIAGLIRFDTTFLDITFLMGEPECL